VFFATWQMEDNTPSFKHRCPAPRLNWDRSTQGGCCTKEVETGTQAETEIETETEATTATFFLLLSKGPLGLPLDFRYKHNNNNGSWSFAKLEKRGKLATACGIRYKWGIFA